MVILMLPFWKTEFTEDVVGMAVKSLGSELVRVEV